jgi:exodeoxyribonuclease VII small subunit
VPRSTKPTGSEARDEELPFEEALKKLESVVETMETDELPLETLLTRFEEGTRLARSCQARLMEAELKIQQLEQNNAGDLVLNPAPVVDPPTAS